MTISTDVHYYDAPSKLRGMAKSAILQLVAPFLFLSFLIFLLVTLDDNPSSRAYTGDLFACIFSLAGLIGILALAFRTVRFNRQNYQALKEAFTLEGRFEPEMELRTRSYSEYLGLDTQNGTIVYFWSVNNKEHLISRNMLAVGFTNYNWRKCELHGNKLVIYTHDPKIPYIEFIHSRAPALYERLCAMQRLDFSYDVNFPGWVNFQAKQVAEELNLNLITVKS